MSHKPLTEKELEDVLALADESPRVAGWEVERLVAEIRWQRAEIQRLHAATNKGNEDG